MAMEVVAHLEYAAGICLIVGFDCGLAVFWAILGAETSNNLFSSIGLFIWRNIQPKSVLMLLM